MTKVTTQELLVAARGARAPLAQLSATDKSQLLQIGRAHV